LSNKTDQLLRITVSLIRLLLLIGRYRTHGLIVNQLDDRLNFTESDRPSFTVSLTRFRKGSRRRRRESRSAFVFAEEDFAEDDGHVVCGQNHRSHVT